MKKLIASLLTAILLTCSASPMEILEDHISTTVVSTVPSSFLITIPETIVADGTVYHFSAPSLNLRLNEMVVVSVEGVDNGLIPLYDTTSNRRMLAEVHSTRKSECIIDGYHIARFYEGDTTSYDGIYLCPATNEGAGDYVGSLMFSINLVDSNGFVY